MSLSNLVLLKVSEIQALVPLRLELGPEVWLVLSKFAIWPSILPNYFLAELLLCWGFNYEWVEEWEILGLLVGLVVKASS